jgi:hypothetical protein
MIGACVVHAAALLTAKVEPVPLVVAVVATGFVVGVSPAPAAGVVAAFAGALFLATELAFWSFERRIPMKADPGVDLRRWLFVLTLSAASVAVSMLLLFVASAATLRGTVVVVAGTVAAAGVVALVYLLTRRSPTT